MLSKSGFTQSFTEHGIIIGLANIRADLNYQQGMRRMWSRRTRYDFYFPAFANLGEQAVLSKEIYCTGDAADDDVFGYQERWAEYRYHPALITGRFRSTAASTLDSYQKMSLKPEHIAKLKDRLWRLNHLYFIEDKENKSVRFKMTAEQLEYFENMHSRNIILKARQLGFTTECCIIQLDLALFHSKHCALIAHTLPDAERLFRNKTKYAYDRLPEQIKAANPIVKETTSELVFQKGGSITVSTSFRGVS